MRKLNIYVNNTKAGLLVEKAPGRGYVFTYDKDYLASSGPAISVNLPKRKAPYESTYLFPFFSNLLPEGRYRNAICRLNKIDERDLFGIMCYLAGADTIGAVEWRTVDD